MIRIAVAGVAGRMGRALVSAVQAQSAANGEIVLTHAFERPGHDAVGLNAAVLVGTGETGVVVTDSIAGDITNVNLVAGGTVNGYFSAENNRSIG